MSCRFIIVSRLVVLCVLMVPPSFCINSTDCGSAKGRLLDLEVSRCEGKEQCPLVRGERSQLKITFEALSDVEDVRVVVHGIIEGVAIPFPGVSRKGCTSSTLSCPLVAGQNYTYSNDIDVKSYYPSMNLKVKWELKDKRDVIVCVLIPVVLVKNATQAS